MKIGKMNTKATIQEKVEVEGDYGTNKEWQDYDRVWGSLENLSGSAYFEAQQANSEVTGMFRIRYRQDLDPTMRLKIDNDRILDVETMFDPDGRNKELHILIKEQTS